MKLRAFDKKRFTADIWDYTDEVVGQNVVRTYAFKETVNVNVVTDNTTRLVISSNAPINKGYQIRNLKDRHDSPVMFNYIWTVNTNEPMLNAFGLVEGYKVKTGAGVEIVDGNA